MVIVINIRNANDKEKRASISPWKALAGDGGGIQHDDYLCKHHKGTDSLLNKDKTGKTETIIKDSSNYNNCNSNNNNHTYTNFKILLLQLIQH